MAVPLQICATDSPGQIVVALPMYRQVSVAWFYHWLRMIKNPCVGLVSIEGVYLPLAMTTLVETALNKFRRWDWLVVLEDDILPPLDAFERVNGYGSEHDIVGSVNMTHEPPYRVIAFQGEDRYEHLMSELETEWLSRPGLYEVDAVSMGFTAINRRVLEKWNADVPMWQPLPPMGGQDIHFCHEAKRQGFSVWLDSGMRCGHLTETTVG
jgi:hypothetical protein